MLQSYMPDHPVLKALIAGDRDIFLEREAEMRAQSEMPPFGRLAGLVLSGPDIAALNNFSRDLAALIPASDDVRVLGPAPAPIARIRNRYRLRFLIKAGKQAKIQQFIASWLAKTKTPSQIRVAIDIDPYNFL
jgi:primosomal protein N' (replication factor Y)